MTLWTEITNYERASNQSTKKPRHQLLSVKKNQLDEKKFHIPRRRLCCAGCFRWSTMATGESTHGQYDNITIYKYTQSHTYTPTPACDKEYVVGLGKKRRMSWITSGANYYSTVAWSDHDSHHSHAQIRGPDTTIRWCVLETFLLRCGSGKEWKIWNSKQKQNSMLRRMKFCWNFNHNTHNGALDSRKKQTRQGRICWGPVKFIHTYRCSHWGWHLVEC